MKNDIRPSQNKQYGTNQTDETFNRLKELGTTNDRASMFVAQVKTYKTLLGKKQNIYKNYCDKTL